MSHHDFFIDVLDVLSPRGNRDFGQAGEHASAQLLPWPSVVSGAIRSAALAAKGYTTSATIKALVASQDPLAQTLALPGADSIDGAFTLGTFCLAQQSNHTSGAAPIVPLPADVVVSGDDTPENIRRMTPAPLPAGIQNSIATSSLPILRQGKPRKGMSGLYLNAEGWANYVAGRDLSLESLVHTNDIASRRHCTGIGMDGALRKVENGQLYTAERIEFIHAGSQRIGYAVRTHCKNNLFTDNTLLRLGGDGHGATLQPSPIQWPDTPVKTIAKHKRFAVVLQSPALFANGYAPAQLQGDHWQGNAVSATLRSSVVGRSETISGWDLLNHHPKSARRFVPTGAVYWFDNLIGDPNALLAEFPQGHWPDPLAATEHRLTEGFNQVQLVAWHGDHS